MTETTDRTTPKFLRSTRIRRTLQVLGAIAVLIALPLAIELTRWSALPSEPFPTTESGPAVGGSTGKEAADAARAWLSDHAVTGVSQCVAVAGEIRWCSASGYADVKEQRELEATTPMGVGSVSKTITAMALARLVERGLIDLDQPIGEIASWVPGHLAAVTLRQLASHTAGVRHYRWRLAWPPHETWSHQRYESVADSLALFADDELLFEPGSDFRYSTHGYTLLGAVLEEATGQSFAAVLEQEIVEPNALSATGLERSDQPGAGRARAYEVMGGRFRKAMRVNMSRAWPGGGVHSSARDLARLASALPTGQSLRPETLEQFLEPQTLSNGSGNPQSYALGWRLAHTGEFLGGTESYRVAHHGGVLSGGSAFLVLFPDYSLAASVITNTRTGSQELIDLAFALAEPFMAELVEEQERRWQSSPTLE